MTMNRIGLLPESIARKNIEKLIKLLGIMNELRRKQSTNRMEEVCLPIQRKAVREEIRDTMRYLRKWQVNIKTHIND